jgi:tetratricopeptide (TPR) repeat protein
MRRRAGSRSDGQLAQYHLLRAEALSKLGRTWEAVEAASGAILAWGPQRHQRRQALDALERVLFETEDLAGFTERLEREVEATGLENPILRKALAAALAKRGDQAGAAAQLELALQVQPNDLEAHQALATAYRAQGREDLLARSLLDRARAAGHDLAPWRELGELLAPRDPAAAERAFTSLVELSPDESEGHAALAELREREDDPAAALTQWDHVVRIRTGEPQGYLGRARALIALGRRAEAREVLDGLRRRSWPEHHGDVRGQVERLERALSRDG